MFPFSIDSPNFQQPNNHYCMRNGAWKTFFCWKKWGSWRLFQNDYYLKEQQREDENGKTKQYADVKFMIYKTSMLRARINFDWKVSWSNSSKVNQRHEKMLYTECWWCKWINAKCEWWHNNNHALIISTYGLCELVFERTHQFSKLNINIFHFIRRVSETEAYTHGLPFLRHFKQIGAHSNSSVCVCVYL